MRTQYGDFIYEDLLLCADIFQRGGLDVQSPIDRIRLICLFSEDRTDLPIVDLFL